MYSYINRLLLLSRTVGIGLGALFTPKVLYSSVIYEYTVRVPNSTLETSRDKKMSVITGIH